MNLPFYIAKRYLLGKKSQNAINIISGISVLGITTGTMALVIVLSVFNGFDSLVKSLYNTFDPDIQISSIEDKTFIPDSKSLEAIIAIPGVSAVSQVLEENVLLLYNDRQHIATVKGVDENFKNVSGLDSMIYDGEMLLQDRNRPYTVVGRGVAHNPSRRV